VKANRVAAHPDLEETIDVAAYAYMAFHRFLVTAGLADSLPITVLRSRVGGRFRDTQEPLDLGRVDGGVEE